MTSQANAYFANKLKERELQNVKVPEVHLKERQLYDVEIPKVQETHRSNVAQEEQKKRELQESKRYNTLNFYHKGLDLAETIRKNNADIVNTNLSNYTKLLSGQKGILGGVKGGIDALTYYGLYTEAFRQSNTNTSHQLENPNINELYDEETGRIKSK